MTIEELHEFIINSDASEISQCIGIDSYKVKLLLSNVEVSVEATSVLIQILTHINKLDGEILKTPPFQILYINLAFYFKQANKPAYVTTCYNRIGDSILKQRLLAWHQYKNYTNKESHLKRFPAYLEKVSAAVSDGQEEYYDEILVDLFSYYRSFGHIPGFQDLFSNAELQERFAILKEFNSKKAALEYQPEIEIETDKVYTPTIFSNNLFNRKFLNYIRNHEDTIWYEILLGYDTFTIRSKIINFGQGHFDNNYEDITSDQIVKLYCYFNMRKHYYSSLYLFERCSWLKRFPKQSGAIKFIDIGCGPATSAIAFIDFLVSLGMEVAKFDYIAVDYYNSMLKGAADMMTNELHEPANSNIYINDLKLLDLDFLEDASCVLINTSYLFASDSLQEDELAERIIDILKIPNKCPKFLFFQNVIDPDKNEKYEKFKNVLHEHELLINENRIIKYNNQRNSIFKPTEEKVRFEVLKF
ncbi:hypothetical protein [Mucilaginibacter arboris]|uniref:Methyltransferase domain-containing protein n=1 Tax=Mucilaginibacter arboris TaxID=2682090 RepID=A0A7K1T1S5_9SPHI|nr:hypothetical protein [Mucilaginibacter arboris]MVN23461.1 hypothetical protein [Mucilaginibacter arboris]